jgi:hypothetical protein
MKNQKIVRINFWSYLKEVNPDLYLKGKRSKRQNEQIADVRMAFTEYLENLRNIEVITEKQAFNYTL